MDVFNVFLQIACGGADFATDCTFDPTRRQFQHVARKVYQTYNIVAIINNKKTFYAQQNKSGTVETIYLS